VTAHVAATAMHTSMVNVAGPRIPRPTATFRIASSVSLSIDTTTGFDELIIAPLHTCSNFLHFWRCNADKMDKDSTPPPPTPLGL
jgi:hypothetical protein